MSSLIWEELIDADREPNIYYLVDGSFSYVTDLAVRSMVSTPLYLKQKLPNETGLFWEVWRDDYEFVKTDFKGDRFYRKSKNKAREIIPAYNFEQLKQYVEQKYPEINISEKVENEHFIFEFSQKYVDQSKTSWYIDAEGNVKSKGKSIYKAQAFINAFNELASNLQLIKMGLEDCF